MRDFVSPVADRHASNLMASDSMANLGFKEDGAAQGSNDQEKKP